MDVAVVGSLGPYCHASGLYLVSLQKDLVLLHLFPVGCPVRAVVGRESWS